MPTPTRKSPHEVAMRNLLNAGLGSLDISIRKLRPQAAPGAPAAEGTDGISDEELLRLLESSQTEG